MIKTKTYSPEIEAIHSEFSNYATTILAKNIAEPSPEYLRLEEKAKKLMEAGFTQCREVSEYHEQFNKVNEASKTLEAVRKYSMKYPHYKFITLEGVVGICKKYNLICGVVDRYTGHIPEENMKAIVDMKVDSEDRPKEFSYNPSSPVADPGTGRFLFSAGRVEENDQPLQICAPQKDMNMGTATLDGVMLVENKPTFPDPVVLCPVHEGYLIITAWGDEAYDPAVLNEKMN